jgi:hypothetical protein
VVTCFRTNLSSPPPHFSNDGNETSVILGLEFGHAHMGGMNANRWVPPDDGRLQRNDLGMSVSDNLLFII